MAQTHAIDGTNLTYITQAHWSQMPHSLSLDLIQVHNRWRRHVWISNVMSAGEWETLRGKRGSKVSITTTDPDDPNNANYVTYSEAIVQKVWFRTHTSLNMQGVRVEFLVRI